MEDARRMLERWRGIGHGAVVLAETQSEGRGRNGRAWVSPPDVNLYFTLVIVPPPGGLRPLPYVAPLAVALAVEQIATLKGGDLHCDLKWPNDVLINDRKLAGVLIETTANPEGATVALVGIGVNVNVQVAQYESLTGIATSARDELGFELPREEVLAAFCDHFERLYEEAIAGSDAPFQAWKQRLITIGREVTATGASGPIRGYAVDVEQDGALVIEQTDGTRVRVDAGDVTLNAAL